MMRLLLACLAVLLWGCGATGPAAPPARTEGPPNIVIVFADDMGYGDLGCYGQTRWRTPHLDRLAAEGVRMTDFYVSQSVCSASRASLLTGCYANRVRIAGALGPKSRTGLNPAETTIAEVCRAAGYATGAYGKWHLGDAADMLPTRQGFDEWFGIPCSNDMWPRHPDLVKLPPDADARKRGYPALPLYENETVVNAAIEPEDQMQFTRGFTERACAFIERNADRPFLVYVAHPMPHVPLFPSPEFLGRSGAGRYGDVIEELDWSVGRIVETLERRGLRERTLVIFMSDNGPWLSYGDHAGGTGGLREGKGTSWEGGVRVPCILSRPGTLPAGRTIGTPAMTIDILPTVAAMIGRPVRESGSGASGAGAVDGLDLSMLLRDGRDDRLSERPLAFYYNQNDLEAVRVGRWKLILPHAYRTLAGPPGADGSPGPYRQVRSGLELYDLEADAKETRDLAAERPEVIAGFGPVLERLRADLGDALTNREGPGRREAGTASTPSR